MTTQKSSGATANTRTIVETVTRAIVEHRLRPGTKLAEQKLADHFGVSRTLVRQALYQMAQNRLVVLEPARGAFVATPSVDEARQVLAVRMTLEIDMVRQFARSGTPARIAGLRQHLAAEAAAVRNADVHGRTELLADFHVRMAELLDNQVLADILEDLTSRWALIMAMYQSELAASHSHEEHVTIVDALEAGDAAGAARLMKAHLEHVMHDLNFDRPPAANDLSQALTGLD
ncbi:GntR family transcriptional regulator [Corticibacter populi]|uniref:GntR family transcriptional regulator n=1 Tax=Corticibacter populi TaxID=1550736 RepID=A0A3M6QHQ4_9BURK|nr:GntR family transcriptional regulator [Corticibacter populi]RMX02640.1 GntR family transcriptional regulator [Corticibacter populi]RZS32941.1 DNA-binding GntR family transcriptional regulator [Corticibacter populi]